MFVASVLGLGALQENEADMTEAVVTEPSACDVMRALRDIVAEYEPDGGVTGPGPNCRRRFSTSGNMALEPPDSNASAVLIGGVVDASEDLIRTRLTETSDGGDTQAVLTEGTADVTVAAALRADSRSLGRGVGTNSVVATTTSERDKGVQYIVEAAKPLVSPRWCPVPPVRANAARFLLRDDLDTICFRIQTVVDGFKCAVSPSVMYRVPEVPDGTSIQVSITGTAHDAVRLRWTPPANAISQSQLRYEVRAQIASDGFEAEFQVVHRTTLTTAVVSPLLIDTLYRFVVVPFSSFGVGEPSQTVQTRTSRVVRPGANRRPRKHYPPLQQVLQQGPQDDNMFDMAPPYDCVNLSRLPRQNLFELSILSHAEERAAGARQKAARQRAAVQQSPSKAPLPVPPLFPGAPRRHRRTGGIPASWDA